MKMVLRGKYESCSEKITGIHIGLNSININPKYCSCGIPLLAIT